MADGTQRYAPRSSFGPSSSEALSLELALGVLGTGAAALFLALLSLKWAIAILGTAAVLCLAFVESEAFLTLVIFLLPLEWTLSGNVPVRDIPVVFRSLVILGFFAGRLLRGRLKVGELLRSTVTKASLLFLCAATLPMLLGFGGLTRESVRALWTLFTCVGFYLVVLSWADSQLRVRKVLHALLISTIVSAAFGIFQEFLGDYTSLWLYLNPPPEWVGGMEGRAPSFFANPNFFAAYLNLVLPFSLACWILGEGRWKKLGAWTTGLGVAALLCTQSFGGLGAFGGVIVLAILCFAGSWKRKLTLLCSVCVLAVAFYFGKAILNPAHEGGDFAYDQSIRLVLWGVAWDFFVHSPIFGVGWGNFVAIYGAYVSEISWIPQGQFEVHNIYLQLLAETGVVGFGAFFLIVFRSVRQALRQWRLAAQPLDKALAFGVLGAILTTLLHGFVDFFFQVSPQFGTLFWVLLSLLVLTGSAARYASRPTPELALKLDR